MASTYDSPAPTVVGSAGSAPTITSSRIARSTTLRAIGPTVSSVDESGITPARDTRPADGRSPNRLLWADG